MHEIDEYGHENNQFVRGNAQTGTPATRMGADWPNAVQNELVNVIQAAGIALAKGTNNQLLQAIQTLNGGPGAQLPDPYLMDDEIAAENDTARRTISFPAGQDAITWNAIELWRDTVAWRIAMELLSSGANTTNFDWRVLYLAVADGGANPIVKERWQASKPYALGDMIIPPLLSLNGKYYVCTTAGDSGASAPTFGTVDDGYTNDNTVVWQCKPGGFAMLTDLVTPPGAAWQRFDFDSSNLQIASGVAGAKDWLHLGFWRRGASDANPDGLHLRKSWVYAVEV
jgi:hypothetical protein